MDKIYLPIAYIVYEYIYIKRKVEIFFKLIILHISIFVFAYKSYYVIVILYWISIPSVATIVRFIYSVSKERTIISFFSVNVI